MSSSHVPSAELITARRAVGAMFFINGATFANWLARIPAVREHLRMDDRTLGFVLLGTTVGALLAFRAAGALIARFGSRRITVIAALCFCTLIVLPTVAPAPVWVAAALFLVGNASGLMDVSMNAQAVEVERRYARPILSSFHGLFSLGGLAGASMGSLAAAHDVPPAWHLMAVSALMIIGVALTGSKLVAAGEQHVKRSASTRPSGALLALGTVAFCSSVGEGAMGDWAAVYMREMLHTSMGTAALAFAAYSLAMLIGRFTGDRITAHFGPQRVVMIGGLIVAAGLGTGLAVNSIPAMVVGIVCVGIGLSTVVPVVFRAAGSLPGVPPGAALATLATLSYSGFLAGPPAIGFIADFATLRGGLGVVVLLALVMTGLSPAVHGRKLAQPRLAEVEKAQSVA